MLKSLRVMLGLCVGAMAPFFLHASDVHAASAGMSDGEAKARASNCFSCHAIEHQGVGPAFDEVAKRYAGKGAATVSMLAGKVKMGGAGHWGNVPMPTHPALSDADITAMIQWILSLKPAAATASTSGVSPAKAMNTYKDIFGKSVQTDVTVFTGADQKTVTPAVSSGYAHYNEYCFRCHGKDAVGGVYAPDLRKSIANGMTYQSFLSTVMTGRAGKGMPSWAGVLEEKDVHATYDYIKARQLDLIPGGRPPSG
jgi:cytochrome c